jgi:hypothetical protein
LDNFLGRKTEENLKMAEGKYGKYVVTEFYDKFELPPERAWEKPIMGRGLSPSYYPITART